MQYYQNIHKLNTILSEQFICFTICMHDNIHDFIAHKIGDINLFGFIINEISATAYFQKLDHLPRQGLVIVNRSLNKFVS